MMRHILAIIFIVTVFAPDFASVPSDILPAYRQAEARYAWVTRSLFNTVYQESRRAGVDHAIILAIIDAESRGKARAVSPVGARGLMQIMPLWHRGDPRELHDPVYNVRLGVRIFAGYARQARGNVVKALKYYERGPRGKGFNGEYTAKIINNYYGAIAYAEHHVRD